jgi:hypothetical protein
MIEEALNIVLGPARSKEVQTIASDASCLEDQLPRSRRALGARYEIQGPLGAGAMGEVFAVRDRETRRLVAVKRLKRSDDEEAGKRFLAEARLTAQLEHPSIIPVYDIGRDEAGEPYYSMRIVTRRTLRDVLAHRHSTRPPPATEPGPQPASRWPLARLLGVLAQVSRAVAYAHARGVDGRAYPWGDRFDPTFCHMRDSRASVAQPEPVGSFPTDESPYGVRDVAGGMREWMGGVYGGASWDELAAAPELRTGDQGAGESTRRVRSGIWNGDHKWSRAA